MELLKWTAEFKILFWHHQSLRWLNLNQQQLFAAAVSGDKGKISVSLPSNTAAYMASHLKAMA